ncbi:MAG: glutamine amidotransferase-related protein [Salinispira sp.]
MNGNTIRGIVLSGGPASVKDSDAPLFDPGFLNSGLPILGICYGLQRMNQDLGGEVSAGNTRELGPAEITQTGNSADSALFRNVPERFTAWMSHSDSITTPAPGFQLIALSAKGHAAALFHTKRPLYGIQFHPEVSHCEYGSQILGNFVLEICGAEPAWNAAAYITTVEKSIRKHTKGRPILLLISGGVDSTVLGALLLRCLPPAHVHLMYIDTGFMRKNETEDVRKILMSLGAENLHIIHAEHEFMDALKDARDPEKKRKTIGNVFMEIEDREVARLSCLYKDDVRELGRELGLEHAVLIRHPFPGPGLAVRIPGEITAEKLEILRNADAIFISELRSRGLYENIWQAFAVLLPLRSVGVAGDARRYNYVCALRAVVSKDGMTADVYPFLMKDLLEISAIISNTVAGVGRVVYDISTKPPATIEWE